MGFGGKGRTCAEATIPRELEAVIRAPSSCSIQPKLPTSSKTVLFPSSRVMSDTEDAAPLTQADIPALVKAVADAIGKVPATAKDPPGEP